jgi:hypothetical protein
MRIPIAVLTLLLLAAAPARAQDSDDRHAGYYYPEPLTSETYGARAVTLPEASRAERINFITGMSRQILAAPYPPQFAIFAKGNDGQKLIIVALNDHYITTLQQARGLLALLTGYARQTPIFREYSVDTYFTFFDLAKLLGFEQITISDGRSYSHQIFLE